MELGPVAFVVSDGFSTNQQNNRDLRKHAQSERKSSKNKTPTTVRNLNACILDVSVLHKLLEALCAQHQALEDAYSELQEERNASAESVDDAMLMISRLQREKFKFEMQHTQYRRETEVKFAHVQEAYNSYEDLLFHKDKDIQALELQLQACRHKFLTYGIDDSDIDEIGSPATRSADDDEPQSDVASYTEDFRDYLTVSSDVERVGSHDSAGFTAQNGGEYEKIWSKGNSSTGSCSPGEVSPTVGFSNYVGTDILVNGGDGHAKSGYSPDEACERRAISSEGYSYFGWSPQLCEAIEGLQKRLSLLSEKEKIMNSDTESELRFSGEKLQSALTTYVNSLRQGSHARQRIPAFSETLEAEEEEGRDGFVEVHVDTEQIRDLPQKTDPSSERYEEDGFSSLSLRKNGSLEPYRIRSSSVGSVIMKINSDPFSEKYEEDGFSSAGKGENGSLDTYKIRPHPMESVIMMINASENIRNSVKFAFDYFHVKSIKSIKFAFDYFHVKSIKSIKFAFDSFHFKSFEKYAQNFHKWEEVAQREKIPRKPSLLVIGLPAVSLVKCLLSGLFVGVRATFSFRGSKRALNGRNYHLTSRKNVGLSNLLEYEDQSENL